MLRNGLPLGHHDGVGQGAEEKWLVTDSDGRFQIAASFEPARIRVIHPEGFAEAERQIDEAPGTLTIRPWAKVSGTLKQDGKPVVNQSIHFWQIPDGGLGEPQFQDDYSSETNNNGHFEFDRLPPIDGQMRAFLGPWKDSPLTSSRSVPLSLQPGENRTVSLGDDGISVIGKVAASGRGDAELNKRWSLNYLIRRGSGIEVPAVVSRLGFDPTKPVQTSWTLDSYFQEWLATRDNYFVKLSAAGDIHVSGVPAGEYDLLLRLYEQPAGCLVEAVGQRVVPIVVTETDIAAGKKDIGRLDVECRSGPRLRQNMQAYKFIDVNGRQQRVYDMQGQYILLHVWASWCAPCMERMPSIQAAQKRSMGKQMTFVGLNIDEEPSRAKGLAAKNQWDWSQNYLGANSDMAKQLAISSVPIYYLIDRKGLLEALTTDWSAMEKTIESLNE